jgi:hypothetical protein
MRKKKKKKNYCTMVYPKVSGLAAWSETANDRALCH